jgi:hypothetical protein
MSRELIESIAMLGDEALYCTAWDVFLSDGALKTLVHRRNFAEVQP